MCFSAQASFIASATLLVIGMAIAIKLKKSKQWWIAAIPFFFGIQQALEGMVWITLTKGESESMIHMVCVWGFLFFAYILWPVYMPLAVYMIESDKGRRAWLTVCAILGVLVAGVLTYTSVYLGVEAHIVHHHISYLYKEPISNLPPGVTALFSNEYAYLAGILVYFIASVGALLLSTVPRIRWLGALIGVSCVIAYMGYLASFASVWCFFAAIISVMTYFVIDGWNKTKKE